MSAYQEHLDPSCPEAMSTDGRAESNTLRVLREVVHSDLYHGQFMPLLNEIDRLRAENAALTAAIERVLALHEPIARDISKCVTCKDYAGYHVDLPCPTLRALEVGRE